MTPGFEYASLGKRVKSILIDYSIFFILIFILVAYVGALFHTNLARNEHESIQATNTLYGLIDNPDGYDYYYEKLELESIEVNERAFINAPASTPSEDLAILKDKARRYCLSSEVSCVLTSEQITTYVNTIEPNVNYLLMLYLMYQLIGIFISGGIVFLLFPMIFKDGQTLGKKVTKLGVVAFNGKHIGFLHLFARMVVITILEIFASLNFFFGLPILLSVIIMLLTKSHLSLHDALTMTACVDLTKPNEVIVANLDPHNV
jgi:uncharacterized RDD family membrane protein YckC